jgi:protein disulfide-isomerase A1
MVEPYKEAAALLDGKAVLAEVDATVEKTLAEEYGIKGFPTLKLFAKGELVSEYKGARDTESFVKYIERAMLPSIDEIADGAALDEYMKTHSGKTIVIATPLDKLSVSFKKQSMSMRDTLPDGITFASVADSSLLTKAAGKAKVPAKDAVLIIRDDATTDVFSGDAEGFEKYLKISSVPLLGELSRENAVVYTELGLPVALCFQDPKAKNEAMIADLTEVARKHRGTGKIVFAWIDSVELKSFLDHLGVADKKDPIAIYEFEGDVKYVMDGEYSKDAVTKWVDDFVAGKILPAVKSEPIPESNDEPVKKVVADSWSDLVEDENVDVLVMQQADWCGHCKAAKPEILAVAKALENVKTVRIATMDATLNDAPVDYKAKGFPTIHFFPAGKDSKGIEYSGNDRKKEDFLAFITKHATHKFDAPTFPVEEEKTEEKPEEEKTEEKPKEEEADKEDL